MATLAQISSPVWSYGLSGGGAIAEGLSAIRQCIDIIIRTTPGTDPLRPEFGSNVYKYQDHPADVAIPNIKKAILEAIAIWEKRVIITSITHILDISRLYLNVNYRLTDDTLTDIISIAVGNGGISTDITPKRLILQGYFPSNLNGYQYTISCVLNGSEILPLPPVMGFYSTAELFDWVKINLSNYGQWYLNAESIVGYMNPEFTSGTLTIGLTNYIRFAGGIPGLPIGSTYTITITVDNIVYTSSESMYTIDSLFQWVQGTLGEIGTWSILTNPGSFDLDFSEEFEVYKQLLTVYTNQSENITISIDTQPE
jgi:phage baseplate assembly protein W